MTNRLGLLLLAAAALLAGSWWLHGAASQHLPPAAHRAPVHPGAPPGDTTFAPDLMATFLGQAMAAEAIPDPLQRCLGYPDPPGSHWSRATAAAYCRYRNQPFIRRDEVEQLIGSGRASELDRRLAEALARQRSEPDSRGLLDRTYMSDFADGSADLRVSLDAWKKQSPRSAFAHAASGLAYLTAAEQARTSDAAAGTPAGNFTPINKLTASAKTDLATAARLDPDVTPTYPAMVAVARMQADADYANKAVAAGLKADPLDYSLFVQMMKSAEPKWGGSMETMQAVAAQAKAKSKGNPLLELLQVEPDAHARNICGCSANPDPLKPATYMAVLDRIAATGILSPAGRSAARNGMHELGVVYLSEALRFQPDDAQDRSARLAEFMEIDTQPQLKEAVRRAKTDEADRIMARSPSDIPTLYLLGRTYAGIESWEKASGIADQLIALHPETVHGWGIRAMVQRGQSLPGLSETDDYILAHFIYVNDPDSAWNLMLARRDRAREALRRQAASRVSDAAATP